MEPLECFASQCRLLIFSHTSKSLWCNNRLHCDLQKEVEQEQRSCTYESVMLNLNSEYLTKNDPGLIAGLL